MRRLTQITDQQWDYVERLQNGVVIARIEATVQRGHVLITVEEHPDLSDGGLLRGVYSVPVVSVSAIQSRIAAMTFES